MACIINSLLIFGPKDHKVPLKDKPLSLVMVNEHYYSMQKIGHSLKSCLVPHFKNKCLFIQEYQIPIFVLT